MLGEVFLTRTPQETAVDFRFNLLALPFTACAWIVQCCSHDAGLLLPGGRGWRVCSVDGPGRGLSISALPKAAGRLCLKCLQGLWPEPPPSLAFPCGWLDSWRRGGSTPRQMSPKGGLWWPSFGNRPASSSPVSDLPRGKGWEVDPASRGFVIHQGVSRGLPCTGLPLSIPRKQRLSRAAHPFTQCHQMALDPSHLGFSQHVFKLEF